MASVILVPIPWTNVVVIVFVSIGVFVLYLLVGEWRKPKLFVKDRRRPIEPLVVDQEKRDKVLRQNFKPELIPKDLDAIVIGSGMGGLTSAALMSLAGKRVLVLEKHDRAGGCTHAFVEKGYEFDVGIHYVGEMGTTRKKGGGATSSTKRMLDQITGGQLQWTRLEEAYDVVAIGSGSDLRTFPIPTGLDKLEGALVEKFPGEAEGIETFLGLIKEVDESFDGFGVAKLLPRWLARMLLKWNIVPGSAKLLRYFSTSLTSVVDSLVTDRDLKTILCYCFGDYGVTPAKAPFAMQSAILSHYANGAFYPVGGSSEIAFHLVPTIEAAGGRVLVRAGVERILTRGNAVVGVRVKKGKGEVDVFAPLVISGAGMTNTFHKLLPHSFLLNSSVAHVLPKLRPGLACFQLFVGLRGSAAELNLKAQNYWCFTRPDLDTAIQEYLSQTAEEASENDIPLMFVSFPSAKDPTWESRFPSEVPKTTCTLVTLVHWDWFKAYRKDEDVSRGRDEDAYDALKSAFEHRLWSQVTALFPQLADKVDYVEAGTPLTHNYYIRSTAGEIYGLDHDMARFSLESMVSLRPDVGVPGLLMTGQDVFTCGFFGALYGGVATAGTALGLGPRIFLQMAGIGKNWREKED